ncbi:amidohydrolase family protein [Novosphingobium rosa]|uniref:amidohydrolase family protein n=1 Tax=Novosphingobium rosa TaxID=76978 RepID=UPI0008332276|nr:amidohydrolase family protein [Novosphingobium rosa]
MATTADVVVNKENAWRLDAPSVEGWAKDVRPGPNKHFMVSVDTHLSPPVKLFHERLDKKFHPMLPRIEKGEDGERYIVMPGARPERLIDFMFEGEDLLRSQSGADLNAKDQDGTVITGLQRIADQDMDGVDAEVIFPNGAALLMWSTNNNEMVNAQAQVWNDWAMEVCKPYLHRCNPTAALCTADIDMAVAEIERVAKLGYRVLTLPSKPVFGAHNVSDINYNLPVFDPMWAAIQDHDLAITYHVSTGRDPRAARGNGGAIINYVCHSLSPTIEPIVNMCASGVFERFPKLRAATIEADAGWVPWMMQKMDEAYLKHHFWVRPKLKNLPSDYYRANCYASFGEDHAAIALVEEFGLENNLMWANDYPHHEGSWPHSAPSLYRTLGSGLREETRAKILGLNAARAFKFEIPQTYR